MTSLSEPFLRWAIVTLGCGIFCSTLVAQGSNFDGPKPADGAASAIMVSPSVGESAPHKFWDKQNRILFAMNAGMSAADFAVTRSNLQRGGQELNPMVRVFGRSTPGLAANFAGETVGVIGLSYFLHKTGHHKLERVASYVNIGTSAGAVGYGLAHR